MVFKFFFRWGIRIILPIVIIGALLFYFGQGLHNTKLESFELNSLSKITTTSFTINGNFFVHNPSKLPIPVKNIQYDVILDETNDLIGSGTISEFMLESRRTSQIPFTQSIAWIPTTQTAIDLATKEKVYVRVQGNITIDIPKVDEYSIPFSQKIDIKEYVTQFVPNQITQPISPSINEIDSQSNEVVENAPILGDSESNPLFNW